MTTYFSEKAKPIAVGLVRRTREPLDVLTKTAEALRSCDQPNEQYRSYVTSICQSARRVAQQMREMLEYCWDGEVPHSINPWFPFHGERAPLVAVAGFSEAMLTGHLGPTDKTTLSYCREINAAAMELIDKLGKLADLGKVELGKIERDGEIGSLESAIQRGWF